MEAPRSSIRTGARLLLGLTRHRAADDNPAP